MADLETQEPTIRRLIEQVLSGQIRVPAFQRGFVWDEDMVAFFIDSIYKGYPFGTLLFWRTKEPLQYEKKLGPFPLPERDPEYPIDYVLDGQQRITSIFGVFQTELDAEDNWTKIYFDYKSDTSAQESQFFALNDNEVDLSRHFPLNCLFDTVAYRKATKDFDEKLATRIDKVQEIFKEARIPIQVLQTEDKSKVSIVFERVNRRGVPLDTLQLLSAWTWNEEFHLQQQFSNLKEDLEPFGFEEVGTDVNLLLRCCAAILSGDSVPETLVDLNGSLVREKFNDIINGVKGGIDFLRSNMGIYKLKILPYPTVLIPLSVFFAVPDNEEVAYDSEQRAILTKWFWKCCFSRRYSSGTRRNLNTDIKEISKLKCGEDSNLGDFSVMLDPRFFTKNEFRIGSVNTQTFILLLAQKKPLSFISGSPITLEEVLRDCNRNEFHHIYPRAYLRENRIDDYDHNCLANFCFLSRSDNNQLGGVAPSSYKTKMPRKNSEILDRAICPESIFDDNYKTFIRERTRLLTEYAYYLMGSDAEDPTMTMVGISDFIRLRLSS